jgi:DNA polymerase-1
MPPPTKTTNPTAMSASPLVLVDGSSYLYRAFHVPNLQKLTSSSGAPTGAIHGVLNMVNRLLTDFAPELIAVVFDAPGKTFRDAIYPDYKAHRPPMPDELRAQIEPAIAAIEALGIRVLRIPGVEADDVIGTLATLATQAGMRTVISTTDKDMTQLVNSSVELLNTMDDRRLDERGVRERYGVVPGQMIDYLALVGDSSDNIPGVPGVGPKTATKWLADYATLDNIVRHADEIGGKVGAGLRAAIPHLPLYKQLVTIKCDVDLPLGPADLRRESVDEARLRGVLAPLDMHGFLRRMGAAEPPPPPTPTPTQRAEPPSYATVFTPEELGGWLKKIEAAELVALDTETTSLSYMDEELVGLSLCVAPGIAAYIPVAHSYAGAPEQLARDVVLKKLRPWLESAQHAKLGHHLKYDAHVLRNHGIELAGIAHDSMLESYVLNSTASRHDMDSLAAKYLGIKTTKFEDVAGKGAKQLRFDEVDVATASAYAAEDADVTFRLHAHLWPKLRAIPELERVYTEIERPLIDVLRKMECTGVMVDTAMLARQSAELAGAMTAAEQAAHKAAGGPFNIGSPKQLQEVLYERLKLPVLGKTPTGQPSTAEDVLAELAEKYDLPRSVLEYRTLAKLKSTYTDKLPREVNARTGRIHTSYHQAVTATGRLSSSDPNLQNIPIRTPEGRRIRQAFVAAPGRRLIAADYSQIELRIMAHLSADARLLESFKEELDVHRATAAEVFSVPREAVTSEQRRAAKAINFGLMYGMSAFGLARELKIERGEAQAYVDLYFERYPGVKAFMERTRKLAREQGYVTTVFGRRLYLPDINARNVQLRQYAERSAINAPMQGTAADIIKRAMLEVERWIGRERVAAQLIMQVHDELVLEVEASAAAAAARALTAIMEKAADLAVPLKVKAGIGSNWDEAH